MLTLLASQLHASAARAAEAPPAVDRTALVQAWQYGSTQVRTAAEKALVGTDAEAQAFLDTGWQQAQRLDDRDAVTAVIADGGPAVRAAGRRALDAADAGDQTAVRTFLDTGWAQPSDTDARVRVNQLMAAGGPQVKQAAQQALDSEDPAVWRQFVDDGWQSQWQVDQRLRVNQAMATGGPEVRAAGQKALDADTPEALEAFLDNGWAVAAARDQETATLTGMLAQAQASGDVAAQETQRAVDEAAKAKEASEAARRSAEEAARATDAARNDTAQAAAQAQRAAQAAQAAANAAKVAVQAAAAAQRAARAAAAAAQRAASAASMAERAATKAYNAAAFAAIDASKASDARVAAQEARDNARLSRDFATTADQAGRAVQAGLNAIGAAKDAVDDAKRAAAANDEAAGYANAAGADASAAIAAAKRARANAERAARAVAAAQSYLLIAASAAFAARDAANRAAQHADAAAQAAIDAADHAGEAAQAAQRSSEAATAATAAAQAAVDTAGQANAVYDAARTADAERIAVERDEGVEAAQEAAAQYAQTMQAAQWDAVQADERDAETNRLLAEVRNPATDHATAVADGRRVAMNLTHASGTWTHQAALAALSGSDEQVLTFCLSGVADAAGQDDRVTVRNIAITDNTKLRDAALAALNGSDATVATFLRTQNYPGRATQDRLKVNQIQAAARTAGDVVTVQKAQEALDSDNPQALRDFVDSGQYTAAAVGQRVRVNQILAGADSGPETKAAAQIALDGPAPALRQFLDVGRYTAAERDLDGAAHLATVAGLVQQINQIAQTAVQNAMTAQAAAARARGDAVQAANYANQAAQSAQTAAGYAAQAAQYANQAVQSVNQAAAAVQTAKAAATRANASARSAIRSAAWAIASHDTAVQAATEAHASAQRAYDSAVAAGEDAKAAAAAADQAVHAYEAAKGLEIGKCHAEYATGAAPDLEKMLSGTQGDWYENCVRNVIANPDELARRAYVNSSYCDLYPQGSDFAKNCMASVLAPDFRGMQTLVFINAVIAGLTAELIPIGVMFAGLCVATVVCGLVLGNLLMLADVGLNVYKYINGDQSLSDTLLNLGKTALESLALAGLAKLIGAGFRLAKDLYTISRAAKQAEADLKLINLAWLKLKRVSACLPGGNSFSPDTPVLLADRTRRPISGIRVGDRVLTTDPDTGVTAAEPVTDLITSTDTELTELTVEQPTGRRAVLHTTPHHRFWIPGAQQWTDAGRLVPGTAVYTPDGGAAHVVAVRTHPGRQVMRNLTVARAHTYYVFAGATPVLVHNGGCKDVVLGLNRPRDGVGSDALADLLRRDGQNVTTYNGDPWGNLDPDTNNTLPLWIGMVFAAIKDPSVKIYVTLDGLDGASAYLKLRASVRFGKSMTPKDAVADHGTDWELAQLIRMISTGDRELNSVEFFLGGQNISAALRAELPKTIEGWKEFRGL